MRLMYRLPGWWGAEDPYWIGDCLHGMSAIPDKSVDLIVTDPPYGITKEIADGLNTRFISECFRILKDGRHIFCFVGQKTLPAFFIEFERCGFTWQNTIVWKYDNALPRETKRFCISYDPILHFSKREPSIFNIIRVPYKSTERLKYPVNNAKKKGWRPHPDGAKMKDIWEIPAVTSPSYSKEKVEGMAEMGWQKPLKLIEIPILSCSNEGEVVFDPFLGSGTLLEACQNTNRIGIGFEIKPEYETIIQGRLRKESRIDV